jgi:hypothetical protein
MKSRKVANEMQTKYFVVHFVVHFVGSGRFVSHFPAINLPDVI